MVTSRAASVPAESVGVSTPLWRRRRTTLVLAQLFLCVSLYAVVSTTGWSADPAPAPLTHTKHLADAARGSSPAPAAATPSPLPRRPTSASVVTLPRSAAAPTDTDFDALATLAGPLWTRRPPAPFLNTNATVLGHPFHTHAQEAYQKWVLRVSGGRLAAGGSGDRPASLSSVSAARGGKGKKKNKPRGNSLPFVTGDAFRELALWSGGGRCCVCDEGGCCTGVTADRDEEAGLLVGCRVFFVKTELLEDFVDAVLDGALRRAGGPRRPIVLVTHNSDYSSPWEAGNVRGKAGLSEAYPLQTRRILDNPRVAAWFAQNAAVRHPKLHPIPIGIENRYNLYGTHVDAYAALLGEGGGEGGRGVVRRLLLANFNPKTNPRERNAARAQAEAVAGAGGGSGGGEAVTLSIIGGKKKKGPTATPGQRRDALVAYGTEAASHSFCLAPPGHGLDTHRLWEALAFGCTPVVRRSPMDAGLLEGLPVLLVQSWEDVTLARLRAAREELGAAGARFEHARAYLPYWVQKVVAEVVAAEERAEGKEGRAQA